MLASDGLDGLRVLSFESRRAEEMAELVRRHGGTPVSAPSMREVPLEDEPAAIELAERLIAGTIGMAVFLTGVGLRYWLEAVEPRFAREALTAALAKVTIVVRGPKPRTVLAELGLRPAAQAAEPNTWRELLAAIDSTGPVAGVAVALQEYGAENPELVAALRERGAHVLRVPVYRWALPDDLGPLHDALAALGTGSIDVALFTSATQVEHLRRVHGSDLGPLFERVVVGSIGPICSQALRERGIEPDFEPEHPKMGQLVRSAASRARDGVAKKRSAAG